MAIMACYSILIKKLRENQDFITTNNLCNKPVCDNLWQTMILWNSG